MQLAREKRREREQELLAEMVAEVAGGEREISVSRSMLRRPGPWAVSYLHPRLDEWMAREGVQPGRLRDVVGASP